jgi:hypothetical protein
MTRLFFPLLAVAAAATEKRVPYLRVGRDGTATLLGEQIGPQNPEPHPAESN